MRWSVAAAMVLMIGVGAGSATAQQSLSEVAGSIKLKNPEGGQLVIDRSALSQSTSVTPASTSLGDALIETTGDCVAAAQALLDLIEETGGGMAFYDDEWRGRVVIAGEGLDQASDNLRMVVGTGRYEAADEMAERGSEMAVSGLDALRDAIASDRPVYSEAKRQIAGGIKLLESANSAVRAVKREEELEAESQLINPVAADQAITSLCGRRFARETEGYAGCVNDQKTALNAIAGRYAPSVGLESAEFNVIRNKCRYEWPGDFVNRDRCERRRIATVSR